MVKRKRAATARATPAARAKRPGSSRPRKSWPKLPIVLTGRPTDGGDWPHFYRLMLDPEKYPIVMRRIREFVACFEGPPAAWSPAPAIPGDAEGILAYAMATRLVLSRLRKREKERARLGGKTKAEQHEANTRGARRIIRVVRIEMLAKHVQHTGPQPTIEAVREEAIKRAIAQGWHPPELTTKQQATVRQSLGVRGVGMNASEISRTEAAVRVVITVSLVRSVRAAMEEEEAQLGR